MSIEDTTSDSVIKLGTLHAWIFKISLMVAPVFALWLVTTILSHDREIAVLKMQIAMMQGGGKGSVSQNVNVGQADEATTELADDARDYVTTADIAQRQGVTERAVIDWIAEGRIDPMPVKSGKQWVIAKNFRIVPNDSECCGETPNQETP
jgi:hypothetical protein